MPDSYYMKQSFPDGKFIIRRAIDGSIAFSIAAKDHEHAHELLANLNSGERAHALTVGA
jgi:hypothetical protein